MLARRVTRTIFNGVEETQDTQDPTGNTVPFVMTSAQFLYVGFFGKFQARHFSFDTANTNSTTMTVEYWDGDSWESVKDLVDETNGFQKDGFVSWVNQDDWAQTTVTPIDDVELYYVRFSVSADLSAGTTLQSVLNLYSDDGLLRRYYPELVSDSRYLPPGRSNFLEQHLAAKDKVVLKLKQRRVIDDEAQIVDINEVSIAAMYAAVKIILAFIDQDDEVLQRTEAAFGNEINDLVKSIDANKDGIVSDHERADLGFGRAVRR
jgi:hypothetical protein